MGVYLGVILFVQRREWGPWPRLRPKKHVVMHSNEKEQSLRSCPFDKQLRQAKPFNIFKSLINIHFFKARTMTNCMVRFWAKRKSTFGNRETRTGFRRAIWARLVSTDSRFWQCLFRRWSLNLPISLSCRRQLSPILIWKALNFSSVVHICSWANG